MPLLGLAKGILYFKVMKKVLLIDVANLFFRAYHAIPKTFTMPDGTPSNAVYGVILTVLSLLEAEKFTHVFAARDLKGPTLRHESIDGYKAGRPEMPDELSVQLPHIFRLFQDAFAFPLLSKTGYEADDVIATVAEHFRAQPDAEVLILSGDQDLFQLVGDNVQVICPQNGGKLPVKMDAEAVCKRFGVPPTQVADFKAMAGDSSDRLVGVPGIGPMGAKAVLQQFATVEEAIAQAEKIAGRPGELLQKYADQALLTKRMATLHRDLKLEDFSEAAGKIPDTLPKALVAFLNELGSRRLIARAEKVFGTPLPPPPPAEQMGMF